ncbi:MAG: tail fiber domain-containing protein [Bacteroidetes bacterium]|nr:tail fiber domain-containing protein [Bacteroidota bacterium]
MKTNKFVSKKFGILLILPILTFFSFISRAQLSVAASNKVGVGTTSPTSSINGAQKIVDVYGITKAGYLAHSSASAQELSIVNNGSGAYFDVAGHATATNNFFSWRLGFYNSSYSVTERMRIAYNGNVGIGITPGATYKLEVNGVTQCTGNSWTSDQLFKINVDSVQSALTTIQQLKPKSYYFDSLNIYGLNFPLQKQYGFIAQDVEQILPELVTTSTKLADYDSLGNVVHPAVTYKSLSYIAFISILTKGIQELQQKNNSLETKTNNQDSINTSKDMLLQTLQNKINLLESAVNTCCNIQLTKSILIDNSYTQSSIGSNDVEQQNKDGFKLYQNSPNPFNQQTSIKYTIPTTTQSANIMVFDLNGKLIKTIPIKNYGSNAISINGNELNPGMFFYSLVVNEKIIDTKRMILTQ